MSDLVSFDVVAADPGTELFLVDGSLALVKRGVGRETFSVRPGIYKIKARCGKAARETLIVVREGMPAMQLDPLLLVSPMPLAASAKTHEYHMSAAHDAAILPTLTVGQGSAIVIVARQWTAPSAPPGAVASAPNPARGLTLRDMSGAPIADVASLASATHGFDPCAALHVALDPGAYRLTLARSDGRRIEQILIACAGWQTHVYLLLDDRRLDDDARPDLVGGAISMRHPSEGFEPADPRLRLEEIARGALSENRKILSPDLRAQVTSTGASPMLALLGAHLLIREAQEAKARKKDGADEGTGVVDNRPAVREIVENLRAAIGPHPDVEAIAIGAGNPDPGYLFTAPPLLRASWRLLLEASVQQPNLLPAGSFGARVAERVWGEGPWLIWLDPDAPDTVDRAALWQTTARVVLSQQGAPPVAGDVASQPHGTAAPSRSPTLVGRVFRALRWLVTRRARQPFPDLRHAGLSAVPERIAVDLSAAAAALSEDQRAALVKRLGVPMSSIDAWLAKGGP
jgi:hypothetical protein